MSSPLSVKPEDEKRLVEQARQLNLPPQDYLNLVIEAALGSDPSQPLIVLDPKKGPRLAGSRIKVSDIAIEGAHMGRSPAEIQQAHSHLSLAQICAALLYYYEHQDEVEASIAESARYADQMRAEAGPSPFELRMRPEVATRTPSIALSPQPTRSSLPRNLS
ncbi:MAG TPA: DUF433 domain-containing protein [Capsulimonadaceae bacterium]|nr:DUF433 domain-containing protein [Capsulimonadaceae bacterium]